MERRAHPHARPRQERKLRLRKPFAVKLVLVLVVLTVGAALWQGARDFSLSSRRLDELKNQVGLGFVRQVALFVRPFWVTRDARGVYQPAGDDALREGRAELERKLRALAASEVGREILDLVIFDAEKPGIFYASLSGQGSFAWIAGRALTIPFAGPGVAAVEGKRDGKAVRSFTAPIEEGGAVRGTVVLYLSAEDLTAAVDRLRREVVRNVILCVLAAIGASVLMGALLARPLRALAHDMRAVSTGDLERRSSVASADEIGDLARTFNRMVESLREVQERRATQKAMEQELGIARSIQQGLLPQGLPALRTWDVAARWTPAKEVGGDYYDCIDLGAGAWGITVADVSGKGIPAALIMSMTRCLLRLAVRAGQGPGGTLGLVEDVLAPDLKDGMFVSMVYLRVEEESGEIRFVRAGHNPPLLVRAAGGRAELCQAPGIALGVRAGFGHTAMEEATLELGPGDILVLYSDGIVEAMNDHKKEFGDARLAQAVAAAAALPAEAVADKVMAAVGAWRGKAAQSDDITLVVLKFVALPRSLG